VSGLRRCHVVCTELPPDVTGGLGRYAERLLPELGGSGVQVEVFGEAGQRSHSKGPYRRTERLGGVTVHRLRVPRRPAPARIAALLAFNVRVAARILRGRARSGTVVAVHDWMGCLAGILCRLLGRVPVVFHVHTCEHHSAPGARRTPITAGMIALENAQARLADLIVVPSASMRDELVARGWPSARMRVVPHGFEDPELVRLAGLPGAARERIRAEVRARYLPGGEGRLIVFAGRLSPHKGVPALIRAVPELLRDRDGDLRVVLLGGRAPGPEVTRLIEREGAGAHVAVVDRFLDPAEVFAHFLAADVCVFPSSYEPFGLVAVEAMALGRPVVTGPGFSPEVLGDGAIRCRTGSPDELAAALARCLDDPEHAAALGRRGAEHVRARYSWALTAKATLAAYAEVAR
jgi:glycogen(starch) synthase